MIERLRKINIFPFLFLLVPLMMLDVATTAYGLTIGLLETNPFFEYQTITGKVGWTYTIILLFAIAHQQAGKEGCYKIQAFITILIMGICAFHMLIVANNLILVALIG